MPDRIPYPLLIQTEVMEDMKKPTIYQMKIVCSINTFVLTASHLFIQGGQGEGLKVNGSPLKLCELFTLLCSLSEGSS